MTKEDIAIADEYLGADIIHYLVAHMKARSCFICLLKSGTDFCILFTKKID